MGAAAAEDFAGYSLNVNLAVDKEHELLALSDIAKLPVDALQVRMNYVRKQTTVCVAHHHQ